MRYDSSRRIAVFLGPSLPRARAEEILPANYYPPARMGDFYRLLGTGVSLIVLIDGVFHGHAPVWQREILEALRNGIAVIGAASMGALRAAELDQCGMTGCGTIYEWYRAGVIDGDDEVALNHGDESTGFRGLSEPLVNIRRTLQSGVETKRLTQAEGGAVLEVAKQMFYGDRSYRSLLRLPVVAAWPEERRVRLKEVFENSPMNLKRDDALAALQLAAGWTARSQAASPPAPLPGRTDKFALDAYIRRGFLIDGKIVSGSRRLLRWVSANADAAQSLWDQSATRYFLKDWAASTGVSAPPGQAKAFARAWRARHVIGNPREWLRRNGLAEIEWDRELGERALVDWMLSSDQATLGIQGESAKSMAAAVSLFNSAAGSLERARAGFAPPPGLEEDPSEAVIRTARKLLLLSDWAARHGVKCPPEIKEAKLGEWRQVQDSAMAGHPNLVQTRERWLERKALADWMVEKGPSYFGHASWIFDAEVLRELQMTGQASRELQAGMEGASA
jgi:hypothetical protein